MQAISASPHLGPTIRLFVFTAWKGVKQAGRLLCCCHRRWKQRPADSIIPRTPDKMAATRGVVYLNEHCIVSGVVSHPIHLQVTHGTTRSLSMASWARDFWHVIASGWSASSRQRRMAAVDAAAAVAKAAKHDGWAMELYVLGTWTSARTIYTESIRTAARCGVVRRFSPFFVVIPLVESIIESRLYRFNKHQYSSFSSLSVVFLVNVDVAINCHITVGPRPLSVTMVVSRHPRENAPSIEIVRPWGNRLEEMTCTN